MLKAVQAFAVAGKLEPLVRTEVLTSSLNPQLTATDFRRPRGKQGRQKAGRARDRAGRR